MHGVAGYITIYPLSVAHPASNPAQCTDILTSVDAVTSATTTTTTTCSQEAGLV